MAGEARGPREQWTAEERVIRVAREEGEQRKEVRLRLDRVERDHHELDHQTQVNSSAITENASIIIPRLSRAEHELEELTEAVRELMGKPVSERRASTRQFWLLIAVALATVLINLSILALSGAHHP